MCSRVWRSRTPRCYLKYHPVDFLAWRYSLAGTGEGRFELKGRFVLIGTVELVLLRLVCVRVLGVGNVDGGTVHVRHIRQLQGIPTKERPASAAIEKNPDPEKCGEAGLLQIARLHRWANSQHTDQCSAITPLKLRVGRREQLAALVKKPVNVQATSSTIPGQRLFSIFLTQARQKRVRCHSWPAGVRPLPRDHGDEWFVGRLSHKDINYINIFRIRDG